MILVAGLRIKLRRQVQNFRYSIDFAVIRVELVKFDCFGVIGVDEFEDSLNFVRLK